MKKIMLCMLITLSFVTFSALAQTFTIVGEEFAPFEFKQNGEVVGIDVDISRHILTKLGIKPSYKILPWKRAWSMVESGEVEAVFTTSRKDKRKPYVIYPEEDMWVSDFVFFVQKGNKQSSFDGFASAVKNNLKIGILAGNSYHNLFWEAFPYKDGATEFQGDLDKTENLNDQLKQAKDLETNLKKLAAGRVDLVIADRTVGQYTAKLNGLSDQLSFYEKPLYGKGYPMPFVKGSKYPNLPEIAKKYEAELKAIKASGEYDKIMSKWLK